MKNKKRKSFLDLSSDNCLIIHQHEYTPFNKERLRNSWHYFDTSEISLRENIDKIILAYVKNKDFTMKLGDNSIVFKHSELKDLAIDFILAKHYFKILDEIKTFEEEFLNNKKQISFIQLNYYGHKFSQIALYKELLQHREYPFDLEMFNHYQLDALKELELIAKKFKTH